MAGASIKLVIALVVVWALVFAVRPELFHDAKDFFAKGKAAFDSGKAKADCAHDAGASPELADCRSASGNTTSSQSSTSGNSTG